VGSPLTCAPLRGSAGSPIVSVIVDPEPEAAEEKEKADAYEEVAEKLDVFVDGERVLDIAICDAVEFEFGVAPVFKFIDIAVCDAVEFEFGFGFGFGFCE
jgi:hypothetical protein